MLWLVTGCSTGLGLEIARAVLKAGQKCIATSRNPSKSPHEVAEIPNLGGAWAQLDVSGPNVEADIEKIIAEHGTVDVVVNNAGYADGGILETMSVDVGRRVFETNVFGCVRVIQALLPSMRSRKSGVIVNISSAEFWNAHPGAAFYAASKWALEGVSEALAVELSPFGIRVLCVEPGGMKTALLSPDKVKMPEIPEPYKGTVSEFVLTAIANLFETAEQDPKKTAEAIVKEVLEPCADPPVSRLPLGKESLNGMKQRAEAYVKTSELTAKIAEGCDF